MGLSQGGVVLRGLWGLWVNIQTSTQTHPAARSHHVVEERGQSVSPPERLTKPRQRAPTMWTLTAASPRWVHGSGEAFHLTYMLCLACCLREMNAPGCTTIQTSLARCDWSLHHRGGVTDEERMNTWGFFRCRSVTGMGGWTQVGRGEKYQTMKYFCRWAEASSVVEDNSAVGPLQENSVYLAVHLFSPGLTFIESILERTPVHDDSLVFTPLGAPTYYHHWSCQY